MMRGELASIIQDTGKTIGRLAATLGNITGWPADLIIDNLFVEARRHAIVGPPRAVPQNERPPTQPTLNPSKKEDT